VLTVFSYKVQYDMITYDTIRYDTNIRVRDRMVCVRYVTYHTIIHNIPLVVMSAAPRSSAR
jgi:hypothetical protein